ncbi:restriction endonuclease subunit S [Haemophilus sp. UMB1048]|uniref:restriction endonuclease subunit S n=1 Tax=Haemophilus sp. UMB1048 TaxID=3046322 RepID=UPI0025540787|nr:restriction endonuclease subunit S [Haemophilus sp. UMB1048]MDK7254853.1 restriction endonuclease subunit S [Haemophilus sp. UMB1048]
MKNNRTFLEKLLDGAEVEWKPLIKVASLTRGRVISKEYLADNVGDYPVYSSQTVNNGEIGKINSFDFDGEFVSWTTDGANAGTVFYRSGKFSITNVCGLIKIQNNLELNYKFLFYWLSIEAKNHVYSGMGNPKLMSHQMEKILIPIPPLSVQTKIVKILDALTALTSELTSELTLRRKQYEYYREKLLSFDSLEQLNMGGAKKKLIDVAIYAKVRILADKLDKENYVGVENLLQNKLGKTSSNYVPTDGAFIEYLPNDILIGNIRPYLRKIWLSDRKGGTNGDVLVIRLTDENILPRYLYHILANEHFFEYNVKYSKGAKMPRGDKAAILQYEFDVPPLEEQHRIVSILDKFETLTNSITEGLPLAIEQSQKRYEYYRELLLSF